MLANLLDGLSSSQGFGIIVVCSLVAGTVIALAAILADARKALAVADLKRRMIDRGMSAEEIATVIGLGEPAGGKSLPSPSEAVVEWGGDWHPAYILKQGGGKFFVHYIGNDVSENEWVEARRVRLPAATDQDDEAGWASAPAKGPVEAEV